ncbi:MAG: hypothetical protein JNK15_16065 [Planctomycetes bacterium]|nr:hypothetical protein [Planctomycetota bacterium]
MKALLGKDRQWIAMFGTGGIAAMVSVLCCYPFVREFVVARGEREALFHLAWSCGMGLGVTAASFDEMLGMREFLMQRALAAGDLLRARMVGCALVLASWFLLVPVVAYAAFFFIDPAWQFGHWQQIPTMWGTMVPAVSACALGLAAGSLPFAIPVRLLALGASFALSFSVVFWLERSAPAEATAWPWFVAGHFAIAALALGLAWFGRGVRYDADQPLAPQARRTAVLPLLALAMLVASFVLAALESTAVDWLRNAWPRVVRDGERVVLATRPEWDEPWVVVDAEHRPTGERLDKGNSIGRAGYGVFVDSFLRVEAPRTAMASSQGSHGMGTVYVDADGSAYWQPFREPLRRLAKSDRERDFAAGTVVGNLPRGPDRIGVLALAEPDGNAVFLFDPATAGFERVPLPDGDRFTRLRYYHRDDRDARAPAAGEVVLQSGENLVCGEQADYVLRGTTLHRVAREVERDTQSGPRIRTNTYDADLLSFTIDFTVGEGGAPFQHRFVPRTFAERTYAALALALAAMRPPVLQAVSGCIDDPQHEGAHNTNRHWLLDPMVAEGRRWWLVAVGIALAAALATAERRRLRRLGADPGTQRFWLGAILLLGPVGVLGSRLCERTRAYARPAIAVPVPPRLASVDSAAESIA